MISICCSLETIRKRLKVKAFTSSRWFGVGVGLLSLTGPLVPTQSAMAQPGVPPTQTTSAACDATALPLLPGKSPVDLGSLPSESGSSSVDLGPFKKYESLSTTLDVPKSAADVTLTAPEPITLDQAIALARLRDRDLQIAALRVEQQRAALQQTRAALYPAVTFQAGIARSDSAQAKISLAQQEDEAQAQVDLAQAQVDQLSQIPNPTPQQQGQLAFDQAQLTALQRQLASIKNQSTDNNTFSSTLNLNYDVFTSGQRPNSIRAAETAVSSAQKTYQTQLQQLRLDVANDYYDLLQSEDLIRIAKQGVDNAAENLRVTQAKETAGIGTRFDVLQADVALSDQKQQLTQAESQRQISLRQLAKRLSLPDTVAIKAADPVAMAGTWSFSLEDSIVKALQNRPELAQVLDQRKIAQLNRKVALGSLGPQVAFNASANFAQDLASDRFGAFGYALGATASKTLFDGGSARAVAAQQQANTAIAETQFSSFKNLIRFQIEQNYYTLQSSKDRILSTRCAVEEAQQSLNLAKLRRDYGVGTSLEVSNATTSLTQAEDNYLKAIIDYNRALASLQRFVGPPQAAQSAQPVQPVQPAKPSKPARQTRSR
jgi:outer membrane factor, OMF family